MPTFVGGNFKKSFLTNSFFHFFVGGGSPSANSMQNLITVAWKVLMQFQPYATVFSFLSLNLSLGALTKHMRGEGMEYNPPLQF